MAYVNNTCRLTDDEKRELVLKYCEVPAIKPWHMAVVMMIIITMFLMPLVLDAILNLSGVVDFLIKTVALLKFGTLA